VIAVVAIVAITALLNVGYTVKWQRRFGR